MLLTRFDAAALVPVLQGRQYLLVHVERASDILQVLALKREFPALKIVLVGASEGWTVADRIARAGVPVIASAVNDLPASLRADRRDPVERRPDARCRGQGVDRDDRRQRHPQPVRRSANMPATSSRCSKIPGATGRQLGRGAGDDHVAAGAGDRHGRRDRQPRAGRRADVVIWSGDPLEGSSAAEQVYIDGVRQPLDTHQTRLRDRYRYLPRRDLPEAYRH